MTLYNIKTITIAALLTCGALPFTSISAKAYTLHNEDEETEDSINKPEHDFTDIDNEEVVINAESGKEEIIEVPEGMIADLDKMLAEYNAKTYLAPDTTCRMRDVNPVYDQSVYLERLKKMPTAMEMPWNDIVQKFIDRYSGKLRNSVSFMLGASNFYMPIFEQALEVYGLPLELKYLPVIESALNPNAVSRVGATGLWQFMAATGQRYGLKINSMIDERRDPVKASYAAAHYLSDLYNIFGDWNLVIAAYNAGPANIQKAIQRAGGVADYWKIYPYLPTETRGYVPAFIAANYIMNYYCEHNICPMLTTLPVQTDTIILSQNVHFEQVANVIGISVDELRSLNPQYRRDVVIGYTEPTDLRLPSEYISKYIANEDSILAYNVEKLMKRDLVTVEGAGKAGDSKASTSKKSSSSSKRSSKAKYVKIRKGDNLGAIARRNGTTVAKLRRLNGIKGSSIRAGKRIRVR